MKKGTDKEFSIEYQYQLYLKKGGVAEDQMHPVQRQETKRAFYGACGQILLLSRDGIADIEDDEECVATLQNLLKQVSDFWAEELKKGK